MSEDSERNSEFISEFVELLLSRRDSRKDRIIIFAGAAISRHAPSCLPVADSMVKETIKVLLEDEIRGETQGKDRFFYQLNHFINQSSLSSGSRRRIVPPEMIYDAIYEFAGDKVFGALKCLKSNRPNSNHRIIASLLDKGFVDTIVTTNFDSLIEQCLPTRFALFQSSAKKRVWKIHGDIDTPRTLATTMRRIGQAAFNEELVDRLKQLLEGSHVLFIGYSGADPDLMPAFMRTPRMASVFWCVLKPEDINWNIALDPWKAIQTNGTQIKWIVGDLDKALLGPIVEKLSIKSGLPLIPKRELGDCKDVNPLLESMALWKRDNAQRLTPVEKARAILQILYNIALSSAEPNDAWMLLIETARAMAEDSTLSNYWYSEFRRDLNAYQAEAYLKLGESVQQPDSGAQRLELEKIVKILPKSRLKIDGSIPGGPVEQLFVHANDYTTAILSLPFEDAVQVQTLLNASTILVSFASHKNIEDGMRYMQGAERLKEGLAHP